MKPFAGFFATLMFALFDATASQVVVLPGSSTNGIIPNGGLSLYEVTAQPPFPRDALWVEIIASRPSTSRQCNGNSITMRTSTSLANVQSRDAAAYTAFTYKNCSSGRAGQIDRYRLSSSGTKIFVAVAAKSQSAFRLDVSYRGKETKETLGELAAEKSHPWHVMIRRSSNADSMQPFCSGTLVSPRWVVTAASCLQSVEAYEKIGRRFDVRLGAYSTQGDDLQTVPFTADDVYDGQSNNVDVGLLRLPHEASISQSVAPVSLPDVDDQDWVRTDLLSVKATFWNLDSHAAYSIDLHRLAFSLLSNSQCKELAQGVGLNADDLSTGSRQICAQSTESDCDGDLGSPLVAERDGVSFLIGVLSTGHACRSGRNDVIFSNILSRVQWIKDALTSESMSANWYPQATHIPFQYSNGGPRGAGPYRGVLMTLETYSFTPSTVTYYGWRNPPHFTIHSIGANVQIYQHFAVNVAARALTQGEPANENVIEIALAWKSPEIETLPAVVQETLAELMRWVETQTGIKRTTRQFYKPFDAYGKESEHRMSELEWKYFDGWCGRQHVPGISNPDPGMLETGVLLSHGASANKYDVKVYTRDESVRAPSSVEISFAGQWGNTAPYSITSRTLTSGSFLAGADAQFSVTTDENLGTLKRVKISVNGISHSWFLDEIKVTNARTGVKFTFPCDQWFDENKGDRMTSRVFSLDGVEPAAYKSQKYKSAGTLQDVAEGKADCTLSLIRGITNQIFHQFHCDNADALTEISSYPQLCMESSVIPYMQIDAAKSLKRLLDDEIGKGTVTVSSAIRSLPHQYILARWQQRGACSQLDAVDLPGKSDHMEGLVINVKQFNQFKTNASQHGFGWAGNASENFAFKGFRSSSVNIQRNMIASFQKLWNLNNPSDAVLVNGQWNDLIKIKLLQSPANGFPVSPSCSYAKPKIPCCRAGKIRGRCTTTEECLGKGSCTTASSSEANLCNDDVFKTCCALSRLRDSVSLHSGNHECDIILYTGDQSDSNSNADIHVKLRGTLGESENIILEAKKGYSVTPGSVLRQNTSLPFSLGDIRSFDVGHFNNSFGGGFYLKKVVVISTSSNLKKRFDFVCNCWLDSSKGYIQTTLQEQLYLALDAKNCSGIDGASRETVKTAIEGNPGCRTSEAYGLAQQIMEQTQCNDPSMLSDISIDPNFCVQNKAFPYLLAGAHSSLQQHINSSLRSPFSVVNGLEPLVFQFIRQKWGETALCGLDKIQAVGTDAFDDGSTLAVTEADALLRLLPAEKWKQTPTKNYLRYAENASDVVRAQIKAFQQLWNANSPKSPIPADGVLTQKTIDALLKSPAKGFDSGARCSFPQKIGSPCCTADKQKGRCVGVASCKPNRRRQGYCSNAATVCCVGRSAVEIKFPSGLTLEETLAPVREASNFNDPLQRGVPLIHGAGEEDDLVSTNFYLKDFFDPSTNHLRLSPLLVECIQVTQDSSNSAINVTSGYQTMTTTQSSKSSSVFQTGTAAVIQFRDGSPSFLLAENVLKGCLKWIRNQGSELGIGLKDQYSLHVELRNHFDAWTLPAAGMSDQQFKSWAQDQIVEIEKDVSFTPVCESAAQLKVGESFPPGKDAASACGKTDHIIKRYSPDFDSLVQYPGSQIAFSSEEKDDAWCGWPGRQCIDCRSQTKGYSTASKCADRLMSIRLMNRLAALQQLLTRELPGHVVIVREAWDEATSSSLYGWGSFDEHSLHYEGRAADISVSANLTLIPNPPQPPPTDTSLLGKVSALANCAGFDHVWYKDKQTIQVSVRKSLGVGTVVSFPYSDFVCVSPPSNVSAVYALTASPYLLGAPCLLDSDGREDELLTKEHSVGAFLSSDASRYFRLHQLIPKTVDLIGERLWVDHRAKLSIEKAYETNDDQDDRLHSLGQGIELRSDAKVSTVELASAIIETAGLCILSVGLGFGTELRENSIYYDVRPDDVSVWSKSKEKNDEEWKDFVNLCLKRASRRITPSNSNKNCYSVPSAPSPTYSWQSTPPQNKGNSTIRTILCEDDDESLQHCKSTRTYREEQVNILWSKLQNGYHFARPKDDVKHALSMCFGELCGKCYKGDTWEKKREHCSNFIHWVPLNFGDGENVGAILAAENQNAKEFGCNDFSCLDRTEIYSVLAPSIFGLYPVQKGSSTRDKIYSPGSNPLPVLDLLQETFAMNLQGKVTIIVENEAEMSSLKKSLKALMLYNKWITEIVVFTFKAEVDAIRNFIENSMVEWASLVCSDVSRKYFSDIKFETFD